MPPKKRTAKSSAKKKTTRKSAPKRSGGNGLQQAANDYLEALVRYGLFRGADLDPGVSRMLEDLHRLLAGGLAYKSEELSALLERLLELFRKGGGARRPIEVLSC